MSNPFQFTGQAPAAPFAQAAYAPPAPTPAAAPAFPVPHYAPQGLAPQGYGQQPAPNDTADLLGGEVTERGVRFNLGQYRVQVLKTTFKSTMQHGDAFITDFVIVGASNGETGERSYYLGLGKDRLQRQYRANELSSLIRALGVPEDQIKAAYLAACSNPAALAGLTCDANVTTRMGRDGKTYPQVSFRKAA